MNFCPLCDDSIPGSLPELIRAHPLGKLRLHENFSSFLFHYFKLCFFLFILLFFFSLKYEYGWFDIVKTGKSRIVLVNNYCAS